MHLKIFVTAIIVILLLGCLIPSAGRYKVIEAQQLSEENRAEITELALNDLAVKDRLKGRKYNISEFIWVLVSYEKPDSFNVRVIGGTAEGLKVEGDRIRSYFNASEETMPMEILPAVVFKVGDSQPYLLYVLVDLHKKKSLGIIWEFPLKLPTSLPAAVPTSPAPEPVRKLTESEKAEIIEIALKNTTEYKITGLSWMCIGEGKAFISFGIEDAESAKDCKFPDERKVQKILPAVNIVTGTGRPGYDAIFIITVNLPNKTVDDIIGPLPIKGAPIPPS